MRTRLGLYADPGAVQRAWDERSHHKRAIARALGTAGLLPPGLTEESAAAQPMTPDLCRAIQVFLARTPCWAILVNLEDLLGETEQTNLPGTVDSYPNWSRKLALPLERLRDDPRVHEVAAALRELRPLPQER